MTNADLCDKMPQEMENGNNNNTNHESRALSNAHTLIDGISYLVSGYSGWMATDLSIRSSMYKNFAAQGVFNDLQKERNADYKKILDKIAGGDKDKIAETVHALEEGYRLKVRERFKEIGIDGMSDWWRTLKRNQRMDAIVNGLTVSGIAIGALMLVSNSREFNALLSRNFESKEERAQHSPSM